MKKFYIIGTLLIVLLAFVACTKEQTNEQTDNKSVKEMIEGYQNDVSTWWEKEVINNDDVEAINEKIQEMKEKVSDSSIAEETRNEIEDLVRKLEDLKEKAKDKTEEVADEVEDAADEAEEAME